MNFDETKTELDIVLGDTGNVTFSPEEKARALVRAWRDSYAVKSVLDETLVYTANTFDYAIPSGITTVKDILYARSTSDSPEPIPTDMWEVTDGRIYFRRGADGYIPDGTTLTVKGNYKYNYLNDTINDNTVLEYVLAVAALNTLTLLGHKKTNLFLKNDTTMAELVTFKRELQADVKEMRLRLLKEYEGA